MKIAGTTRSAWSGHVVGAAVLAAAVLNGLGPYARRVGAIEKSSYERYWVERCGPPGVKPVWLGFGRQCVSPERWWKRSVAAYIRAVHDYEWPMKAAKDVVMFGLMVVGMWEVRRSHRSLLKGRQLPMLLAIYVVCWAFVVLARGDWLLTLAGLRSFAFLAIALLCSAVASRSQLAKVSTWSFALVCVECLLIPWEVLDGIKDKATLWLPLRVAGTMVNPNTLGLVAVSLLGFALSFRPSRPVTLAFWPMVLVLVACAGSGVGWVVIVTVVGASLLERLRAGPLITVLGTLALGICCLSAIGFLTGRRDILFSLFDGRLPALGEAIRQETSTLFVGSGLGTGTNLAVTWGRSASPSDSTVTMLIQQGGIVALAMFYALLAQAWYRTRTTRPFFLAIMCASAVANIIESFPVNALLGLALAESMRHPNEPRRIPGVLEEPPDVVIRPLHEAG